MGGETVRRKRNPAWTRDELILAMDLYVRHGLLDDSHPEVIELSRVLGSLPIHPERDSFQSFRNPNGVALKLANFAAIDTHYPGKGMARGGRSDKEVWAEFEGSPGELERLARLLRAAALDPDLVPPAPEPGEELVREGAIAYRLHRHRERDRKIVARKKQAVLRAGGSLSCEVCDFEFGKFYGELGDGYIECHHRVPLAASGPTVTAIQDLALVCANCHRVIHRSQPWLSVSELRGALGRS